jgi:hypothetical protein
MKGIFIMITKPTKGFEVAKSEDYTDKLTQCFIDLYNLAQQNGCENIQKATDDLASELPTKGANQSLIEIWALIDDTAPAHIRVVAKKITSTYGIDIKPLNGGTC